MVRRQQSRTMIQSLHDGSFDLSNIIMGHAYRKRSSQRVGRFCFCVLRHLSELNLWLGWVYEHMVVYRESFESFGYVERGHNHLIYLCWEHQFPLGDKTPKTFEGTSSLTHSLTHSLSYHGGYFREQHVNRVSRCVLRIQMAFPP